MDVKKLVAAIKALFTAKGIQLGENESALETAVENFIKENPGNDIDLSKLDLTKFGNTSNEKLMAAVLQNQSKLEAAITSIQTMVKENFDSVKTEKETLAAAKKAEHEKNVKTAVDSLIITKKAFPESMRDHLTKIADANLESFNLVYKDAKAGKEFTADKTVDEGNKNVAVKSTSGNATALKAIQGFQANAETVPVESTETK